MNNEEISVQLLTQATDNIQKLFETITRMDERVKNLKEECDDHNERLLNVERCYNIIKNNFQSLHNSTDVKSLIGEISGCQHALIEIDKRLISIENIVKNHQNRWEKIGTWIFQLIWVLLMAWLLSTLHLQSPPNN